MSEYDRLVWQIVTHDLHRDREVQNLNDRYHSAKTEEERAERLQDLEARVEELVD